MNRAVPTDVTKLARLEHPHAVTAVTATA